MNELMLEMRSIIKSFSTVQVLKGIDFTLKRGEIIALLGENGAGKTTLMNILGGVLPSDGGTITLEGAPIQIRSTAEAKKHGIAFVHQELNIINDLAIYENIFLGSEKKKGVFLDAATMVRESREILKRLDVDIDPTAKASTLDASYKQIVEIAGAIRQEAKIIIMDEPTTSLTNVEIDNLFKTMRALKEQGISLIFISHKLGEVLEICDSYFVMRDGHVVIHDDVSHDGVKVAADDIARHMVGKDVVIGRSKEKDLSGAPVQLQVEALGDGVHFHDVNFAVRRGEILGITGLLGDGRSHVAQCIFGCIPKYKGQITLDGKAIRPRSESQAKDLGIGYIPKNRKENGIIPFMSILHNFSLTTLSKFKKGGMISKKLERDACNESVKRLNIKVSNIQNRITSLSGGNQQKVVLAKWLEADLSVLIFDNPTQGVDVGAKAEIYSIIEELAESGLAIIVLSSEAQEIIRLCDRTLVMYHGTVNGELSRDEMTENSIMVMASVPANGRLTTNV